MTPSPDAPPRVRLVVGLGNPGTRYARTRHNVGRMVAELVARRLGVGRDVQRYAGRWSEARGPAGPVAFLMPETYMNESGRAVGPAAGALRAAPEQVLLVHDEIDLPFGTVRGKSGGGHGGHNGLRSVDEGLGARGYPRVRVGVGRPPAGYRGDEASWVLSPFGEDPAEVEALIARAADMVEAVLAEGIEAAIARFHAAPPGARARARAERRDGSGEAPAEDGPDAAEAARG
ncbi:MAG TPA: aminoacyl-tRNA hydrolase [Miltoncostaeaceae bacterium]|nr:aminoacyl-tRNA hydrolase [Miltoncostaeaceae bacterium]